MSQFSGKCDLYDCAVEIGGYDIKNIRLYLRKGERFYPLKLEEPRDLIPYYPYVPFLSHYSDGIYSAYISESFIDQEEKKLLECDLECLLREYRRAKRKKEPFNPDTRWYNNVIINRVKRDGEKATIKGIHRPISNHWREKLAKEMEANGYKEIEIVRWVYPDKLFEDFDWHKDTY